MKRTKSWAEGFSNEQMKSILVRHSLTPRRRGRKLRNQFELWARKACRWIPEHLRMPDFSHCYCHGLTAAPGHEGWNL